MYYSILVIQTLEELLLKFLEFLLLKLMHEQVFIMRVEEIDKE
jgi:hypothetical protein